MLLDDERYVVKWLSQYGALPTVQIMKMLRKEPHVAIKIIKNLKKMHQIADIKGGYYLGLDAMCQPDQRITVAVWVLLRFINQIDPMAHYPASHPAQIFFLKDNTGYEIITLYDGEEHLLKLLQPDDDLKYIIIVPHISMAAKLKKPDTPCLFATVDFNGSEEPDITFYSEGDIADETQEPISDNFG